MHRNGVWPGAERLNFLEPWLLMNRIRMSLLTKRIGMIGRGLWGGIQQPKPSEPPSKRKGHTAVHLTILATAALSCPMTAMYPRVHPSPCNRQTECQDRLYHKPDCITDKPLFKTDRLGSPPGSSKEQLKEGYLLVWGPLLNPVSK